MSAFGRKTVYDRAAEERGGGSSGSSAAGNQQWNEREEDRGYGGKGYDDFGAGGRGDYGDYGDGYGYGKGGYGDGKGGKGGFGDGKGGYGEYGRGDYGRDYGNGGPGNYGKGGPPDYGDYRADYGDYGQSRATWDEGGDRRGPWEEGDGDRRSYGESPGPKGSRGRDNNTVTLIVSKLSQQATERDLGQLFEQAGLDVDSVHISVDRETGQSRGQAFVDIRINSSEDPEVAADFATHRLSGTELRGQAITVDFKGDSGGDRGDRGGGYGKGGAGPPMTSVFAGKGDGGKGPNGMGAWDPPGKGKPTPVMMNPKAKLVICQYWKENRCNRGEMCSYAHGEHELRTPQSNQSMVGMGKGPIGAKGGPAGKGPPMPPAPAPMPPRPSPMGGKGPVPGGVMPPPPAVVPGNRKTQLCSYFKEGRCSRGNQCNYAHGENELSRGGPTPDPRTRDPRSGHGNRTQRGSRSRSQRRQQRKVVPVAFSKSDTLAAVERSESTVHDPPPPRERGTAAAVAAAQAKLNGSKESEKEKDGVLNLEDDEAKKDAVDLDAEDSKEKDGKEPLAVSIASFLLNEEGAVQLDEFYGLGARLLRSMGWQPGKGIGANTDGELEPASISILSLPSTHYGRKDRRCLGRRKPRRFRDSDESSPSRTLSTSVSRSSSKSSAKSSKRSESSSSHKKKRKRKKKKKKKSSSSKRSSSSSSSSSSKEKRKKKGKFTSTAPSAPPAAAAAPAGGAAAGAAASPQAAAAPPPVEDAETAQAKKRVLAKLTEMQKIEPKEARAKEFRTLLRDWHPDKNPEKKDMATAVFQFLQKGKSLLRL